MARRRNPRWPHPPWDKLWPFGGQLGSGRYATDLWSSMDGENWRKELDHVAWGARHNTAVHVFKRKVWIAGGTLGKGEFSHNDIWTFEVG